MQKIIDGRRYNTETARFIRGISCSADKPTGWEERLYRTKSGLWFLHSFGGKKSRYAVPIIQPVSEDAAVAWLDDNFGREVVQEVMCKVSGIATPVTVLIPQQLLDALEQKRAETGQSRTDVVLDALRNFLK